jgi:signal transduction histidine kinase
MNPPHILLVDDDTALLQALPHMMALRINGVQVDTCDSAQDALEQIQEQDYDAIVSDIKMPGMDGLELLSQIQALRPEVPTLLITGHAEQALITSALRAGAYDFIAKPIDRVYFVAALHRAIQTRQLRRQVWEQQSALETRVQELEGKVEQQARELLGANQAMQGLVSDLQDVSLIDSGKLVLQRSRCELVEICQLALAACTASTGRIFTCEAYESSLEVEVDREHIGRVLQRLLANSCAHSPIDAPISLSLRQVGDEAVVSVRDRGAGMKEEELPHLCERFYHIAECEVHTGGRPAVGLGLYLSRHIIELHGGRIEVQSAVGQGSTITAVLPLTSQAPAQPAGEESPAESGPSPFSPPEWLVS